MSDDIDITMSTKDQQTLKALQNLDRALEKIADRMGNVEKQSKQATETSAAGFSHLTGHIAKAAGEFLSLQTILEGVKKHFEDLEERRREVLKTTTDYAGELKKTVLSAGGFLKTEEVDAMVKGLADKARADPQKTAAALKSAFEVGAVRDKKQAESAAETARAVLELHKDEDAETIGNMTAMATRIRRTGGPGTSPEAAVGQLERISREAGFSGPEVLAKKAIPALKRGVESGMTMGESGALMATLATSMEDATGKTSVGAFDELVSALRHHFPGQDPAVLIRRMEEGDTALYKQLHSDALIGGKKVPAASFSDKNELAIESLLKGKDAQGKPTEEALRFQRLTGTLGDLGEGQKFYRGVIADLRTSPEIRTRETAEEGEAFAKRLQLQRKGEADRAAMATELDRDMAAGGYGWFHRTFTSREFALRAGAGEDPKQAAASILRRLADGIDSTNLYGSGGGAPRRARRVSEDDARTAAEFRKRAEQIEEGRTPVPNNAVGNERRRMGTGEPGSQHQTSTRDDRLTSRLIALQEEQNRLLRQIVADNREPQKVVDVTPGSRRPQVPTVPSSQSSLSRTG